MPWLSLYLNSSTTKNELRYAVRALRFLTIAKAVSICGSPLLGVVGALLGAPLCDSTATTGTETRKKPSDRQTTSLQDMITSLRPHAFPLITTENHLSAVFIHCVKHPRGAKKAKGARF